jgi:hypothetical protein
MNDGVLVAHLERHVVKENTVVKTKKLSERLLKALLIAGVSLVALVFVARFIWRSSGSNRWEVSRDQNGVKVYTLKSPGSDLIQVKGIVRVHSTLGGLMKLMLDPTTGDDFGYYEVRTIDRVDDWLEYRSFRLDLPFPFQRREFVVRSQAHQDPRTKEVLLVIAGAPDKAPPNDCCFRVTDMNNAWRFTPVEKGQVEIEYTYNTNVGGSMPDLLLNTRLPKFAVNVLSKLQELLNRKNYQDARLDFIKELE